MFNLDFLVQPAALVIALLGVLEAAPHLLVIIDPRKIRCWLAGVADRDQIISRSAALQQRLRELESLGFSLLGVKNEKLPLWWLPVREVAMASR